MITPEYWAGLFDGEGCITYYRGSLKSSNGSSVNRQYILLVTVTNTYKPIIDLLRDTFKGSINTHGHNEPKRRPAWKWMCRSRLASDFLRLVQPHLILKRTECDIALELHDRIRNYKPLRRPGFAGGILPLPQSELDAREALVQRLKTHPTRRHDPRYFLPTL